MPARTTIEGLDELKAHVNRAFDAFAADLREAALDAAAAGVLAAQADHPYKDWRIPGRSYRWRGALGLTDTSHAEQPRIGSLRVGFEAEMVWPADYAGFVNDGTSRSRPYPFVPTAERAADAKLASSTQRAVDNLLRALG